MYTALAAGGRVEIRGFVSFNLNYCPPRAERNRKARKRVEVPVKYVPHFNAGKELRQGVDTLAGDLSL